MKLRQKQQKSTKPPSILKKSQSHKHIGNINKNQLFDNAELKDIRKTEKTDSVYSSFQETLKQQLRNIKRKENGGIEGKEKKKMLGHRLIEEIKELSEDNVILTKIVVEFMESISSNNPEEIISHFKNTLNLMVKAMRGKNKENAKQKDQLKRKNSVKEIVIHSQNLQDQLSDTQQQLKLYINLLKQQKQLCKSYSTKLTKLQKSNNIYSKNQNSYQLQRQHLIKTNKRLQQQISITSSELISLRSSLNLQKQKLHCCEIQNQTLHQKNKQIQRQLFDCNKQLNNLKLNKQNKVQVLQKQNILLKQQQQQLYKQYDSLQRQLQISKQGKDECTQLLVQIQYLKQQILITQAKFQQSHKMIVQLQQQSQKRQQRERILQKQISSLQFNIQKLEEQRNRLSNQIKSLRQINDYPRYQSIQKQKSNKKLKALEQIQAIIRKHRSID